MMDNISFPPKFKISNHYNDKDLLFLDMFASFKIFFYILSPMRWCIYSH